MSLVSARRMLSVAGAVLALLLAASAAAAYQLTAEPAGEIEAPSEGSVTFTAESATYCPMIFFGQLSQGPIPLTSGALIGYITSISITSALCSNGAISLMLGLPYEIRVDSILGSLPDDMAGILVTISGVALLRSTFGGWVNCLYGGTLGALLDLTDTGTNTYRTIELTLLRTPLSMVRGSWFCSSEATLAAKFALGPEQDYIVY